MLTIQFRKSITEVLDILEHMEKSYTDKIPAEFKKFLNENKETHYKPQLDHSKKLNEKNLSKYTKDILGIIYYKYWCDNSQKVIVN